MRLRVLALATLAVLGACARASDPDPPPAFGRYVAALRSGNYASAYRLTTLTLQPHDQPGFALTSKHFEAFFRAHPLRSYDLKKVTKLAQDTLDQNGRRLSTGTARFVIDVVLHYADMTRSETWEIEGTVVGLVDIGAASLPLRIPTTVRAIGVDGVATSVSGGGSGRARSYYLTVMNGGHVLTIGSRTVEVLTDPLAVRSGPARVSDGVVVVT